MKKLLVIFALLGVGFWGYAQSVDVIYFHGKQRCVTCLSIEKNASEVVQEMSSEKLYKDRVDFDVVDFSTEEGQKVAQDYKVTWSTLILVKGDARKDVTQLAFRYSKNQPEEFKKLLRKEIESLLQ